MVDKFCVRCAFENKKVELRKAYERDTIYYCPKCGLEYKFRDLAM